MQIQIHGKQVDIGDALRTHVSERLAPAVAKYYDRATDAQVTISKEGNGFKTECAVHLSTGIHLQARGHSNDPYASVDGALARLEKQLRRYKRRLRDHHANAGKNGTVQAFEGASRVIAHDETEEEEDTAAGGEPVIVAETTTRVETLTVSDAVMRLDLADARVLVFVDKTTQRLNIVYRRDDGHIGWIDPGDVQPAAAGKNVAGKKR